MKKIILLLFIVIFLLAMPLFSSAKEEPKELMVYNAASTTDVMEELAHLFMENHDVVILLNPSSSGTLARQIEEGAPADLYLSANQKWMDYVTALDSSYLYTAILKNQLVWISSQQGKSVDFTSPTMPEIKDHLSIGDPAHVPAGKYAQEALMSLGWYDKAEAFILPGNDVRAALSVVELGEAQWGIVYETDAMKSSKAFIAGVFPEETHSPILYSLALLNTENNLAVEFFQFLQSPAAAEVYRNYGFTPLKE